MEASSTYPKTSFLRFLFTYLAVPLLLFAPSLMGKVYGQEKVFVKRIESQSNVDNPNNVLVGQGSATETTFATLNSGTALIVGNWSGHLEQDFQETLPANTTSYVRIGVDDAGLLNALLGGSLGTLLDDVVGVLLGNHSFEVNVKNSAGTSVLSGTSGDSFENANGRIRIVQNALGQFFFAITPNQPYSRIRITDRTSPGLIAANEIDVYGAYYVENEAPCAPAFGTSFDGTGLTVDLLGIGGAGVTNPQFAIDSDPDNYSEIAIGTAGIGASMFQTVYFNTVSAKEDYFKVTLAIENGGALTADLIGNIEIRAYNGAELVFSKKLQGGLINGLDLLGLLQSGDPVTLPFGPGVEFDRVAVGYNSLISLSVLANSPIQLYSVERYGVDCPDPDPIVITPTDPMLIQKDCAAEVLSFEHANFPYNAVDGNNDTYATLEASSGILLGGVLGEAYSGHIELEFNEPVAASKTVYVRIEFDEEQLGSLLDGSVGELLGGAVDGVLFGNHYFTVEAKSGAATILERSSNSGFNDALGTGNGEVKIVQDKNGHYYVAVTSEAPFQSIRITEHLSALVGAGTIEHMNVYHACFSTGAELCEQAFATYSESEGISLDLLSVGDAGVTNAHLAIDDDDPSVEADETFSEIGIGTAGVGASAFQFVDFHTLSSPADYFKVKIGFEDGSLLDVELLNNIEIRAYNGNELVYSQRLQNGLVAGLDILGLLSTDDVVTIPIGPGKAFDRVAVGVSTLVDINALGNPVRLYSIKRFGADCPDPNPLPNNPETESPFNGPDCGVELGEFENTNFAYNAIDGDIDTYATLSAGSGVLLGAGAYDGFLELSYDQPVPALETSYIRIDMPDEGLLDALVGGSLGNLLADVGDLVLFGNHYFDLSVRDAAGDEIYNISSMNGFPDNNAINNARIVRDDVGRYYIAFTADEPYQSVRITLNNTAVAGLDAVTTMNVYSMCRETVFDPCEQATFTSFDGDGLSLSLLEGANPAGVNNPHYVIDGNNSNYSELTLGAVGVGVAASIYQDIYYKTKVTTTATDKVRLRMQVPQSLANVDLLGGYTVYLYNGDQLAHTVTLRNALINEVDLLGLLNTGGRITVEIEPGADVTYDRVRFEVASLVGVGVASPVRLYNVYRISDACPDPEFEQPPFEVCADVIVDDGENVDDIQNLTDGNHNSYATIRSDAGLVVGIGAYSGHVELGFGAVVPAGTSSYIRIGYEEEILNSLLAGSIGDLVNGVLNGVALGDHYFNVIVNDENGDEVVSGSSQDLFDEANGQIRLVQDTKGRYYLEIRPTASYQSVRLEDHTTALLGALSSEGHLDVYGLCHTPTTFECPAAFSTSYEGGGLNLDALNLGGAGAQNAFWAIDQNTSSASTLSLGTVNVGGSIQQNIQFDQVIPAGDPIQMKMKVGDGTLNAGVLSDLEVIGYLDGVEVFTTDFNTAFVEANIVDVLNGTDPAVVTIDPTGDIDEIAIRLSSVASVSIAPNVSIYYVIPLCESFIGSSLSVTKNNAFADGVDYNEVTATILDQDGDAVANQEVEFTIVNVDGSTTTETVTTDGDGEAILQFTSTLAGDASVTAVVGGMVIADGSPAEVTFVIPNNLLITKVADDARVTAGESATFTVTITNDGPAPIAVGKVIPLNERPGVGLAISNYAVTSANATVSGTGNNASVTTTAAVPVGGTITLTITADVAANAPDEVFNGIDVWGPDRNPDNDVPDDSDDTGPIPVDRDYGLAGNITKIAADGTDAIAVAGEAFAYTVTVVNGGPSTILSGTVLYLQDALSAGQTISAIEAGSANITVGTIAADGSFTVTANEDIEETEQFTLTVTADVAGDIAADVVNNTINIWSEDPAGDYSTPEGTFTTPDYPVDRDYGFDEPGAVVKAATDGPAAVATAGEAFSYTVTLTNMGPSVINAGTVLYLQEVASAGQTVTGITADNGTVGTIGSAGEFTLTVADPVAVNGTIELTVTADVAADIAADEVNNTIHVWTNDPAGDYSDPDGTATTPDYPVDRDYGFDDDHIAKVAV
ncbi:Ig-like domain-containing protein, partial [Parapedobacter defluvii]|uniref:Ig-like domain-containing protein n=2 Tax=Parapedobacter defluvii TaxID=2045106 RepID=UPI00166D2EEC